jgi:hypothetical protein
MGWQDWYNSNHTICHGHECHNISHYHLVNLTGSSNTSMTECYLKVNLDSTLDDGTSYVYTTTESVIAGIGSTILAIVGTFLNFLVILALLRCNKLREEYLTPSVVSLATTDLLYSMLTLPMLAMRYFVQ